MASKQKHPERSWRLLAKKWNISDKTLAKYWHSGLDPENAPRVNEGRLALTSDFIEQRLVLLLLSLNESGTDLTSQGVVQLAEEMARDLGTLAPGQHLGRTWLTKFKARRPVLSNRFAELRASRRRIASIPELQRE